MTDWQPKPDATGTGLPLFPESMVGSESGIGAHPNKFYGLPEANTIGTITRPNTVPNPMSVYWMLDDEQQDAYRRGVAKWGPQLELLGQLGFKPPELPAGNLAAATRGFASGFWPGSERQMEPVVGGSPAVEGLAQVGGEAAKYAGIYKALARAGLTGLAADFAAGGVSGAQRQLGAEDPSLGDAGLEALITGGASGLFRSIGEGAATAIKGGPTGTAPKPGLSKSAASKVSAPTANMAPSEQSVVLNFFGWNPQIEQSISKAWSGVVDKTTEKMLSLMPQKVKDWVHHAFWGNAPAEVKQILKQTRVNQIAGQREAVELGQPFGPLSKTQKRDIYSFLDPEALGEMGAVPGPLRNAVDKAQTRLYELGQDAVEYGVLDEETFYKNAWKYLGRYYTSQSGVSNLSLSNIKRLFVKGGRFKHRSLDTPEARRAAGIITDPQYAVSRTISDLTFDIETLKAFRRIASNKEWTRAAEIFPDVRMAREAGFVRIPKDKMRYGDLSDQWLQKDIADEIFALVPRGSDRHINNIMGDVYDKLLASWKYGKTALNPATHGRNVFSNFILADVGAGLSPTRVDIYGKALKEYIGKGKLFREAKSTGLFGTDWFGAEVGSILKPGKKTRNVFDMFNTSIPSKIVKAPGKLYQGEEHWFKMAVYMHQRELGASVEQAAAHAQKYLFDYSDLSPMLQKLRRNPFGGPFLTFTAKALPVMVESAVKRPVRFWKYPIMMKALHEYSKHRLGITEEEWKRIEMSLPEWRRNGWNVMLPWRSTGGKPRLLDLTYNLPWGQIGESPSLFKNVPYLGSGLKKDVYGHEINTDVGTLASVVDPFIGSNPFTNLAADVVFNRDRFLDKPIWDTNVDDDARALGKIGKHAWKQLAPGFMLAAPDVATAITGGKDKYGQRLDLLTTSLNKLAGIKVVDIDVERGLQIKVGKLKKKARSLLSAMISAAARHSEGGMSDAEFDKEKQYLEGQIKELEAEARELTSAYNQDTPKKRNVQPVTDWQ